MRHLFFAILAVLSIATASAFQIAHGPYLQNLTSTDVTIVWVTDSVSVGWVELAPNDKQTFYAEARERHYDVDCGIRRSDRVHVVRISGLQPGTTYRYRIYSTEILNHVNNMITYGRTVANNPYTMTQFTTIDPDQKTMSFSILNDIHDDNAKLKDLVAKGGGADGNDFFIYNGDMTSMMRTEADLFGGFIDESVRQFASKKPFYYVRGNHETRGYFAPQLHKYLTPSEPNVFYTFTRGDVCFVMLDTGEDKPDTDIEYYGITDYEGYRSMQAEWLKTVIKSPEYQNAKFRVVVAHMPPNTNGWFGNRDLAKKITPVLNTAVPDIMICAHEHRHDFYDVGKFNNQYPILVNSNNSVVKVDVDGNKMTLKVIDRDGKEVSSRTITK